MAEEKQAQSFNAFVKFALFLMLLWATITSLPEILFNTLRRIFPPTEKDLKDKHVLITGSGKGLGRAMAFQFAKNGSRIICVDIDEKANEDTCRQINKMRGNEEAAKPYTCDVSKIEDIYRLRDLVLKDFVHVDILVNNAGLIYGKPILEEEESMVQKVVDVNQMSSYWMVRNFLPHMKERNAGHIVFINSIASLTVLGDAIIYTVTKYALLGLTLSLADEFTRDVKCANIKLSSVHPYFIATDGLKSDPRALQIRALKAETAAREIVTGIKREYFHFTVPGYELGYWLLCFSRVLPLPIYNKMVKLLYNRVLHPTKKSPKELKGQ